TRPYHRRRAPHPPPTRRSSDLTSRPGGRRWSRRSATPEPRRGPPPATPPRRARDQRSQPARSTSRGVPSSPTAWIEVHSPDAERSEEHTSELQSRENLVCRLLL